MGGCVSSQRGDINDAHPNIFSVSNIDDDGNKLSEGHLEVTDNGLLVLHQKGKDAVHWPLKSLRRYGAEADVFSFESGRKCKTGPGIYAFRCDRAERLLALLQEKVRSGTYAGGSGANAGGGASTRDRTASTDAPPGEEANHHQHSTDSLTRQISSEPGAPAPPSRVPPVGHPAAAAASGLAPGQGNVPDYANVNCNGGGPVTLEASDGYLVPNTPVRLDFAPGVAAEESLASSSREYENVAPSASNGGNASSSSSRQRPAESFLFNSINNNSTSSSRIPPMAEAEQESSNQCELVLAPAPASEMAKSSPAAAVATAAADAAAADVEEPPQINYIAVDFESTAASSSNLPAAPSSPSAMSLQQQQQQQQELRGAYCTIDIDRTKALSTTAKQQSQRSAGAVSSSDSPVGVRKTRHNSTLQELAAASAASSSTGGGLGGGGVTSAASGLIASAVGKRNSIID